VRKVVGESKVRSNTTFAFSSTAKRYLYYAGYLCDESFVCYDEFDGSTIKGHISREKGFDCHRVICAGFDWLVYLGKKILRLWMQKYGIKYYKPCFKVRYTIVFVDDGEPVIEIEPIPLKVVTHERN